MNVEKAIHYTQSGPSSDMQHASPSARDVRPVWTQTQPWTATVFWNVQHKPFSVRHTNTDLPILVVR